MVLETWYGSRCVGGCGDGDRRGKIWRVGCKVGWQVLLSKNHVTDSSVAPNGTG